LFFLSLFSFFLFLPVYLDEMIPGFERLHIMLFLIVPYLQIIWNTILSLVPTLWGGFHSTWLDSRIPPGSLFVSVLPFYAHKENDKVFYMCFSTGMGSFLLWIGLLLLNSLEIIHHWIASFAVLWLMWFIPGTALFVVLLNDNNIKVFDVMYFGIAGLSAGVWLILVPLHIDGFVTWHYAYIFLPLLIGEYLLFMVPFVSMFVSCCDVTWSDLGDSSDNCCAFLAVFWPPVGLFVTMEALIILLVEAHWGYWTCAFIPIYLLLCGAAVAWCLLYSESIENCRRPAYFLDFLRA